MKQRSVGRPQIPELSRENSHNLQARIPNDEYETFHKFCLSNGLTISDAIRALIKNINGIKRSPEIIRVPIGTTTCKLNREEALTLMQELMNQLTLPQRVDIELKRS
jgi:hypothetical protein